MDARGQEAVTTSGGVEARPVSPLPDGGRSPTLADRIDDGLIVLDEWRQRRGIVAVGSGLVLACVLVGWWMSSAPNEGALEAQIPQVSLSVTTAGVEERSVDLVVHVIGEVNVPGVYELRDGQRIEDAVQAAGGATRIGDLHALNLAAPLVDGAQIRVPAIGDPPTSPLVVEPAGSTTDGPVNLNSASAEQLESLPGVGPSTAAAIIDYRTKNGSFLTLDDLLDVPGIGPAKLAGFADKAVV